MQDVHERDAHMYLFYHFDEACELLVDVPLPCAGDERHDICVTEVLGCRHHFYVFALRRLLHYCCSTYTMVSTRHRWITSGFTAPRGHRIYIFS